MAVRYCIGCGQEFGQQARFCSNCGTRRPTSPLTKANPAPTFTPEEILASLEEEGVAQEQAAEAPRIENPDPVRDAARVPPPQQAQTERAPTPEAAVPVPPPPSVDRAPRVGGTGPEPSKPERDLAEWFGVLATGLVFFVLSLVFGVGVEVSLFVGFVAAALGSRGLKRSKRLVSNIPAHTRHIPQDIKVRVAARDGARCVRCGSTENLQFDHLIPFSRGGSSTDVNNIQLLCGRCNRLKSNRYVG